MQNCAGRYVLIFEVGVKFGNIQIQGSGELILGGGQNILCAGACVKQRAGLRASGAVPGQVCYDVDEISDRLHVIAGFKLRGRLISYEPGLLKPNIAVGPRERPVLDGCIHKKAGYCHKADGGCKQNALQSVDAVTLLEVVVGQVEDRRRDPKERVAAQFPDYFVRSHPPCVRRKHFIGKIP